MKWNHRDTMQKERGRCVKGIKGGSWGEGKWHHRTHYRRRDRGNKRKWDTGHNAIGRRGVKVKWHNRDTIQKE